MRLEGTTTGVTASGEAPSELASSGSVCMAPWVHAHFSSLGHFTPCCEIFDPVDPSDGATLASHWNSSGMAGIRRAMLAGDKLNICQKCHDKEAAGLWSQRLQFNEIYEDQAPRLAATEPDGRLPQTLQPIDVDIRFSNLCNFRCRSCWHGASSRWFSDAKVLGLAKGDSPIISAGVDCEQLLTDVMERASNLRHIYFAGGEPLLMEEHYILLDHLIRVGRTDLQLTYNSNLSELALGDRDVTALWQRFDNVHVRASADGMGAVGELVRKGLSWARFRENIQAVRQTCPHVKLQLMMTVSVLNLLHVPEFCDHVSGTLEFDHDDVLLKPLQEPAHYNIQILPRTVKAAATAALLKMIETWPEGDDGADNPPPWRQKSGRSAILEILAYMNSRDRPSDIRRFLKITAKLDKLRSEDTFATIPALAPLRPFGSAIRARAADMIKSIRAMAGFER